jgi:hypothetical protein
MKQIDPEMLKALAGYTGDRAAGLVLTVMACVCARASWAAGIAASIGHKN